MKIDARKIWWSAALIAVLTVCACMPGLAFETKNIPGKISVGLGFNHASKQTTTFNGYGGVSTTTNGSETSLTWNVDYRYPLGNRFGVGASLMNWKFDPIDSSDSSHGGTSFCFMGSYLMGSKSNSEVFLGVGSDLVRIGYRSYFGKNEETADRGMFYCLEFDAPTQDDVVDSFGGISIGYSF
jgi:hypothetical protein